MNVGRVKWFSVALEYGFIAISPTLKLKLGIAPSRDLYVHASGIVSFPKDLPADARVEFEIDATHPQGPRAINVRVSERVVPVTQPLATA